VEPTKADATKTVLQASNIKCLGCAAAAKAAVGKLPGVTDAAVDLANQTVTVNHEWRTSRVDLAEALTKAGFPAS
jgi:copper chaperone CopZ